MLSKPVSIVFCVWNCLLYIDKAIGTLSKVTDRKDLKQIKVICVDNGSKPETINYLRNLKAKGIIHTLIENGANLGFSKGNNIGIKAAGTDDVLLLNTDTEIIQSTWLAKMQETAYSKDDIGVVGCRQRNGYGFLMHADSYMLRANAKGAQIGWGLPDVNQYNSVSEVEGVVGSCMYIKREVIDKIGGLPEEYESYYEDTVFCLKTAEAGYKTYNDGRVTIIHHQNTATRENNVSFDQIYNRSRQIFIRDWSKKLFDQYKHKIAFRTLAGFSTGYGQASKNIIVSLDRNNVDVRYDYIYGVTKLQGFTDWRLQDVALKPFDDKIPQVTMAQGDALYKNSSRVYRIGYTMLETSGIPKEWVNILNDMDEVWTCTKFNKETFTNSGVKKPIYVIPLGIDPNLFNPGIKPLPKNKGNKRFTFVSCFEYGERKAPDILLRAFNEEFTAKDNVQLVLKINNNDKNLDVYKSIANTGLLPSKAPIHILYNTEFYEDTLGAFYNTADCFVSATMGEGWGMPQLEAGSCGLPVITTGWSGVTEFMNKENGTDKLLVDFNMIPAIARCPYYEGFMWSQPKIEDLKAKMLWVYEHQDEAKEYGLKCSEILREKYSWDNSAKLIIERLKVIGY
jgi:hypothetical protein